MDGYTVVMMMTSAKERLHEYCNELKFAVAVTDVPPNRPSVEKRFDFVFTAWFGCFGFARHGGHFGVVGAFQGFEVRVYSQHVDHLVAS